MGLEGAALDEDAAQGVARLAVHVVTVRDQHVVDLQTAWELFFSAAVVASLVVTAVSLAQ